MDDMTNTFDEFFNDNDNAAEDEALKKVRGRGKRKREVEEELPDLLGSELELPDIGLDVLSSGELPEVVLVDSYDDGQHLLEPLPDLPEEHVERIDDSSGDFSGDYETSIVEDDVDFSHDSEADEPEVDEPEQDIDSILAAMVAGEDGGEPEESHYFDVYEQGELDVLHNFQLDAIIADAIDMGASDIHLSADDMVSFTILGAIHRMDIYPGLTGTMTQRLQQNILSNVLEDSFINELELDTSYVVKEGRHKGRRTRLSVGKSKGEIFMVFRIVADKMPRPHELGVTGELLDWITLPNGLVMMNGPTGTGKALRLDTPIPTPNGVKTMGSLAVGDTVYDRFMRECKVTWVSNIDENPKLYSLKLSDGQTLFADRHHRWLVTLVNSLESDSSVKREGVRAAEELRSLALPSSESEFVSSEELFSFLSRYGYDKYFYSKQGVELALRYMECPSVSDVREGVSGPSFSASLCLPLLSLYLLDRFSSSDSSLRVMTTEELVVSNSRWATPKCGVTSGLTVKDLLYIEEINEISSDSEDYGPVRCITVDSDDHSFLCGDFVVTHNSTTLASMLQEIQFTRSQKIITLERPIEFVFGTEGEALITQREIGRDARSFASALTSAMRQAPDIIMVGEVRNRVEVNELLRAAETGHLAISTMHTNSTAATINRIKSLYEGDDQLRILASLSDVARGFANQVLLKTMDGKGRFAVREVLTVDEEVAALIQLGDVPGIRAYQEERGITMEHGLVQAVLTGKCTRDVALSASPYPRLFNRLMDAAE